MDNIKMIVSDLDGTLLTDGKGVSENTKEILKKAAEKNIIFVPATGRAYSSIPQEVLELPGVEYVITSNGAAVYSVSLQKRIYECLLEEESVNTILKLQLPKEVALEVFIEGVPYTEDTYWRDPAKYGATAYGIEYVKRTRKPLCDIQSFIREHRHHLDSIDFVCAEPEIKLDIKKWLENHVKNIYITSSIPHLLEVSHKNGGKGKTLAYIAEKEQVKPEEIIAFGDGDNDIEMLEYAGVGYAMGNASEQCKKAANRITDSNEKDGVSKVIINILKKLETKGNLLDK